MKEDFELLLAKVTDLEYSNEKSCDRLAAILTEASDLFTFHQNGTDFTADFNVRIKNLSVHNTRISARKFNSIKADAKNDLSFIISHLDL